MRIIPLCQNCGRRIYIRSGGIKDCQNMHQTNFLCYRSQNQFLEGKRQREYKLGNQLFYHLLLLLQTFVQNSILLPESDYFPSQQGVNSEKGGCIPNVNGNMKIKFFNWLSSGKELYCCLSRSFLSSSNVTKYTEIHNEQLVQQFANEHYGSEGYKYLHF